jgi:hypothetical protein
MEPSSTTWRASERCPEHLKRLAEDLVNAMPVAWLKGANYEQNLRVFRPV